MIPAAFKEQIQQIKQRLGVGEAPAAIKNLYLQQINELINQLNRADAAEKQVLLEQIKESDYLYLEAQGMVVQQKVLFTRHGECGKWAQKGLGFNPNSAIADSAIQAMSQINTATQALLSQPGEEPRIAISPMVRAMQTASLIIPKNIIGKISIETFLSENSVAPSGHDVRTYQDLVDVSKNTSFFSAKGFLFFVARLIYRQKDFDALDQKRTSAADKIQQHNHLGYDIYKNQQIPKALDYKGDKIKEILSLIKDSTENDVWLIGHGNNFASVFQEVFGIKMVFEYAETRIAYKIQAVGLEPTLYTPPYSLAINQNTGEIEGLYTGISKACSKNILNEPLTILIPSAQENAFNASPNLLKTSLGEKLASIPSTVSAPKRKGSEGAGHGLPLLNSKAENNLTEPLLGSQPYL